MPDVYLTRRQAELTGMCLVPPDGAWKLRVSSTAYQSTGHPIFIDSFPILRLRSGTPVIWKAEKAFVFTLVRQKYLREVS